MLSNHLFARFSISSIALAAFALSAEASDDLRITEISAGPSAIFVEIYNPTSSSQLLTSISIETSKGVYSLSDLPASGLAPGAYAMVVSRSPSEVRISTDPNYMIKVVGAPLVGVSDDTCLLTRGQTVIDAVSYGLSLDTSTRYQRAVQAGQLQAGTFVSTAKEYGELCLGRDNTNTDTDSMAQDWSGHGGKHSYSCSPLAANTEGFNDEAYSVKLIQRRLNEVLTNTYFGVDVINASYGSYSSIGNASSASHSLTVTSPAFGGPIVLVGNIAYQYVPRGAGASKILAHGKLESVTAGVSLQFDYSDTNTPTSGIIDLDADLVVGGVHFPYSELITSDLSGIRGAVTLEMLRKQIGNLGTARTTNMTVARTWTVANGAIASIGLTTDITRDWPINDYNVPSQVARLPYTTEVIHYESVGQFDAVQNAFHTAYSNFSFDYGPSIGVVNLQGATHDMSVDASTGALVSTFAGLGSYGGSQSTIEVETVGSLSASGNVVFGMTNISFAGSNVATSSSAIDPPVLWPSWDEFVEGVKSVGRAVVRVTATVLVGGACALASGVAFGVAVGGTFLSMGVALPVAILGIVIVGGICAIATSLVWEEFGW